MRTAELFKFMHARHAVYIAKLNRRPKPWTQDTILQQYRFCNVYRELDTVTQWIAKNWRAPHAKDRHLWFAMVVARLFNWPPTLELVRYPKKFDRVTIEHNLAVAKIRNGKVFSSAYIVSTNGRTMDKAEYLVEHVLAPLWKDREIVAAAIHDQGAMLASVHATLSCYNGLGSFMAAQIIADLKYVKPLSGAPDWRTWAASGPGSRRGLNRVLSQPVDSPWKESQWHAALRLLHEDVDKLLRKSKMPLLHAQDLQNSLCEFDKYQRVLLGEGRPRQLYPGV